MVQISEGKLRDKIIEEIIHEVRLNIEFEKSKESRREFSVGFISGLERAIEIIKND